MVLATFARRLVPDLGASPPLLRQLTGSGPGAGVHARPHARTRRNAGCAAGPHEPRGQGRPLNDGPAGLPSRTAHSASAKRPGDSLRACALTLPQACPGNVGMPSNDPAGCRRGFNRPGTCAEGLTAILRTSVIPHFVNRFCSASQTISVASMRPATARSWGDLGWNRTGRTPLEAVPDDCGQSRYGNRSAVSTAYAGPLHCAGEGGISRHASVNGTRFGASSASARG